MSIGSGVPIAIGRGQKRALQQLIASIRHKSRRWHRAPTMRSFGVSSSTAHGWLHSLHARGAIAIDPSRGCQGETLFTLNPRYWHRQSVRRGMLARFTQAPGQLAFMPPEEPEPDELLSPGAGEPHPPSSPAPRVRSPQDTQRHIDPPAGDVPPAPESMDEKMDKYGFKRWW